MTRTPTTEFAEEAVADLETYGSWVRALVGTKVDQGRIGLRYDDARPLELVVAGMVGVIERYLDRVASDLVPSLNRNDIHTWKKRERFFVERLGLDLKIDVAEYLPFRGFVEARNAIMHGSGCLTAQQSHYNSDRSISDLLTEAGLRVEGGRVRLKRADVERLDVLSMGLVARVDQLAFAAS